MSREPALYENKITRLSKSIVTSIERIEVYDQSIIKHINDQLYKFSKLTSLVEELSNKDQIANQIYAIKKEVDKKIAIKARKLHLRYGRKTDKNGRKTDLKILQMRPTLMAQKSTQTQHENATSQENQRSRVANYYQTTKGSVRTYLEYRRVLKSLYKADYYINKENLSKIDDALCEKYDSYNERLEKLKQIVDIAETTKKFYCSSNYLSAIADTKAIDQLTDKKIVDFINLMEGSSSYFDAISKTKDVEKLTSASIISFASKIGKYDASYYFGMLCNSPDEDILTSTKFLDLAESMTYRSSYFHAISYTGRTRLLTSERILGFAKSIDQNAAQSYFDAVKNNTDAVDILTSRKIIEFAKDIDSQKPSEHVNIIGRYFRAIAETRHAETLMTDRVLDAARSMNKDVVYAYFSYLQEKRNIDLLIDRKLLNSGVINEINAMEKAKQGSGIASRYFNAITCTGAIDVLTNTGIFNFVNSVGREAAYTYLNAINKSSLKLLTAPEVMDQKVIAFLNKTEKAAAEIREKNPRIIGPNVLSSYFAAMVNSRAINALTNEEILDKVGSWEAWAVSAYFNAISSTKAAGILTSSRILDQASKMESNVAQSYFNAIANSKRVVSLTSPGVLNVDFFNSLGDNAVAFFNTLASTNTVQELTSQPVRAFITSLGDKAGGYLKAMHSKEAVLALTDKKVLNNLDFIKSLKDADSYFKVIGDTREVAALTDRRIAGNVTLINALGAKSSSTVYAYFRAVAHTKALGELTDPGMLAFIADLGSERDRGYYPYYYLCCIGGVKQFNVLLSKEFIQKISKDTHGHPTLYLANTLISNQSLQSFSELDQENFLTGFPELQRLELSSDSYTIGERLLGLTQYPKIKSKAFLSQLEEAGKINKSEFRLTELLMINAQMAGIDLIALKRAAVAHHSSSELNIIYDYLISALKLNDRQAQAVAKAINNTKTNVGKSLPSRGLFYTYKNRESIENLKLLVDNEKDLAKGLELFPSINRMSKKNGGLLSEKELAAIFRSGNAERHLATVLKDKVQEEFSTMVKSQDGINSLSKADFMVDLFTFSNVYKQVPNAKLTLQALANAYFTDGVQGIKSYKFSHQLAEKQIPIAMKDTLMNLDRFTAKVRPIKAVPFDQFTASLEEYRSHKAYIDELAKNIGKDSIAKQLDELSARADDKTVRELIMQRDADKLKRVRNLSKGDERVKAAAIKLINLLKADHESMLKEGDRIIGALSDISKTEPDGQQQALSDFSIKETETIAKVIGTLSYIKSEAKRNPDEQAQLQLNAVGAMYSLLITLKDQSGILPKDDAVTAQVTFDMSDALTLGRYGSSGSGNCQRSTAGIGTNQSLMSFIGDANEFLIAFRGSNGDLAGFMQIHGAEVNGDFSLIFEIERPYTNMNHVSTSMKEAAKKLAQQISESTGIKTYMPYSGTNASIRIPESYVNRWIDFAGSVSAAPKSVEKALSLMAQ